MRQAFVRFALVGSAGFFIDLILLQSLIAFWFIDPIKARGFSFACAITSTWLLNRKFTFVVVKKTAVAKNWLKYALVNGFGGAINFLIFAGLVTGNLGIYSNTLVAFCISAGIALMFNFLGSHYYVFGQSIVRLH